MPLPFIAVLLAFTGIVVHVSFGQTLPSSFPNLYPNIPNPYSNFTESAAWQNYFEVKDPLPNVTFPLTRSFAGNIPVNRQGHPNNTLFFWAYEKTNGSLTALNSSEPWIVWLNGGPGSSSMLGLLLENGPIHFNPDFTPYKNNFSWEIAADTFWIDQPVGTGWSTSDNDAFVADEDQMGRDFMGFLSNLVQVFPSLEKRPMFLMGESYAGVYVPYITKTYFSLPKPPVLISKIAMGDGLYSSVETCIIAPTLSVIETYPQLIGYDPEVFKYFQEQTHLCHYDINLTYPQNGIIPPVAPLPATMGGGRGLRFSHDMLWRTLAVASNDNKRASANKARRALLKRDLSNRAKGTIDPWYKCDTFGEMIDYALNFSAPWVGHSADGFDVYDIPDALQPEAPPTPDSVGTFLNDPRVVAAIHAPTSKMWVSSFTPQSGYPFGSKFTGDPSPTPMNFFSEMATNLSSHNMSWSLFSGNSDSLVSHMGTEIVIQNTTFGGIQGFTQKPSTPFFDQQGNFAGKIHQERGLIYALFIDAGHLIPQQKPIAAFTFLREFILGNNPLGSVLPNGTVVGGTNATLAQDILPEEDAPIYFGAGATQGGTVFPSATIAAWDKFTATAAGIGATHSGGAKHSGSAGHDHGRMGISQIVLMLVFSILALVW